jgi:hypothetical protein
MVYSLRQPEAVRDGGLELPLEEVPEENDAAAEESGSEVNRLCARFWWLLKPEPEVKVLVQLVHVKGFSPVLNSTRSARTSGADDLLPLTGSVHG